MCGSSDPYTTELINGQVIFSVIHRISTMKGASLASTCLTVGLIGNRADINFFACRIVHDNVLAWEGLGEKLHTRFGSLKVLTRLNPREVAVWLLLINIERC